MSGHSPGLHWKDREYSILNLRPEPGVGVVNVSDCFSHPKESFPMKSPKIIILSLLALVSLTSARAEQFSVLLFSKTAGWHHDSINAGVTAIQQLGQLHDFNVFWTEDANRVFNDKELAKSRLSS